MFPDDSVSAYSSGSDPGEEDLVFDLCNKSDDEAVNNGKWLYQLLTKNRIFFLFQEKSKQ